MKKLGCLLCLVALKMANQMPLGIIKTLEPGCFISELLHPVLAKDANPSLVCLLDALQFNRLAYGHQGNRIRATARAGRGLGDSSADVRDIIIDGHEEKPLTTKDTK